MIDQSKEGFLLEKGWVPFSVKGYYISPKNINGIKFGYKLEDAFLKASIEQIQPSFLMREGEDALWLNQQGQYDII